MAIPSPSMTRQSAAEGLARRLGRFRDARSLVGWFDTVIRLLLVRGAGGRTRGVPQLQYCAILSPGLSDPDDFVPVSPRIARFHHRGPLWRDRGAGPFALV